MNIIYGFNSFDLVLEYAVCRTTTSFRFSFVDLIDAKIHSVVILLILFAIQTNTRHSFVFFLYIIIIYLKITIQWSLVFTHVQSHGV